MVVANTRLRRFQSRSGGHHVVSFVVAQLGEGIKRTLTGHRDADGHRFFGDVPDSCRIDLEVLALVVDELTAEQLPDDEDRLAEHVGATLDGRPTLADDVLVEVFAGAQAQGESAVGQDLQGRCSLRSRSPHVQPKRHTAQALPGRSARSPGCIRSASCATGTRPPPSETDG
jgi:hypothetical protein